MRTIPGFPDLTPAGKSLRERAGSVSPPHSRRATYGCVQKQPLRTPIPPSSPRTAATSAWLWEQRLKLDEACDVRRPAHSQERDAVSVLREQPKDDSVGVHIGSDETSY